MNLIPNYYVQKSNWFLFPLLNIKKGSGFTPVQTYLMDVKLELTTEDYSLICVYKKEDTPEFYQFEELLLKNQYFKDSYETEHYKVYIFDLSPLKEDYDAVVNGKYSTLSKRSKLLINQFFGKSDRLGFQPHPKIQAYLYPDDNLYTELEKELTGHGVTKGLLEHLKDGGELLSKPDLIKETLDLLNEQFIRDPIVKTRR